MCADITYKTYTLQVKNKPHKNVSPDEKKIRPSFLQSIPYGLTKENEGYFPLSWRSVKSWGVHDWTDMSAFVFSVILGGAVSLSSFGRSLVLKVPLLFRPVTGSLVL